MNDTPISTHFSAPRQPANDIRLQRPMANDAFESFGKPFECLGQTWIVHRAWSIDIGGLPRFDIVDMKTGRSVGQVAAPNVAAARIVAISSMTMLTVPSPKGSQRPQRSADAKAGVAVEAGLPLLDMAAREGVRSDARLQAARNAA